MAKFSALIIATIIIFMFASSPSRTLVTAVSSTRKLNRIDTDIPTTPASNMTTVCQLHFEIQRSVVESSPFLAFVFTSQSNALIILSSIVFTTSLLVLDHLLHLIRPQEQYPQILILSIPLVHAISSYTSIYVKSSLSVMVSTFLNGLSSAFTGIVYFAYLNLMQQYMMVLFPNQDIQALLAIREARHIFPVSLFVRNPVRIRQHVMHQAMFMIFEFVMFKMIALVVELFVLSCLRKEPLLMELTLGVIMLLLKRVAYSYVNLVHMAIVEDLAPFQPSMKLSFIKYSSFIPSLLDMFFAVLAHMDYVGVEVAHLYSQALFMLLLPFLMSFAFFIFSAGTYYLDPIGPEVVDGEAAANDDVVHLAIAGPEPEANDAVGHLAIVGPEPEAIDSDHED